MNGAPALARRAAVLIALVLPHVVSGQGTQPPGAKPELRVDDITDRSGTAVQVGAGVQVPFGYYTRVGLLAAAGSELSNGGQLDARLDIVGRFLLDPFRQMPWGLSAGAGVSVRAEPGRVVKPFLLAVVDLEGPRSSGGVSPAFQVGLGGGVRFGVALRWGAPQAR